MYLYSGSTSASLYRRFTETISPQVRAILVNSEVSVITGNLSYACYYTYVDELWDNLEEFNFVKVYLVLILHFIMILQYV
jgi:hypothetical protein